MLFGMVKNLDVISVLYRSMANWFMGLKLISCYIFHNIPFALIELSLLKSG